MTAQTPCRQAQATLICPSLATVCLFVFPKRGEGLLHPIPTVQPHGALLTSRDLVVTLPRPYRVAAPDSKDAPRALTVGRKRDCEQGSRPG